MVVSAALEKRSFFGAGGEGSSGLAGSCGGVDGAGWVSWPFQRQGRAPLGGWLPEHWVAQSVCLEAECLN